MNKRGYLSCAAVGVGWAIAAFSLAAAPGCGGSGSTGEAQYAQSPRESIQESIKHSQAQMEKQKSTKRSRQRR